MRIKHIVLLLVLSINTCFSNEQDGHFFLNLKDRNIPTMSVIDSFPKWFDIDGNTEFKIVRNDTDGIGMLHQAYQQYYKGIPVSGCIVLVHSQNDIIKTANGVIMRNSDNIEVPIGDATLKSSNATSSKTEIISFVRDGKKTFRTCLKTADYEKHKLIYTDVKTGDTLKILSTTCHATANGYTMYHGWQKMNCSYDKGEYILYDDERNIYTLYGGSTTQRYTDVTKKRDNSLIYSHTQTQWGGVLTNIKISWSAKEWWYDLWDTNPDFYLKIKDSRGNLLYKTNVKDDSSAPVSWNLKDKFIFLDEGSTIEIYDNDATSDSYGGNVVILKVEPGTYTWSNEKTSGTYTIEADPAIDAHWGMQRVYDFYKEKLGRNGYNNLGTRIYQFVDLYGETGDHEYNNAYFNYDNNGIGYMVYGLGDNIEYTPFVALDIMGHEFSHSVTSFNGQGGLDYESESGALNESFSDIIGTAIEFYALGKDANWTIGESICKLAINLRDMKNPKNAMCISREKYINSIVEIMNLKDSTEISSETWDMINSVDYTISNNPQPNTYKGKYWVNTDVTDDDNDHGGVHTNSGVQNHWFYLLSEGGKGKNDNGERYDVRGIGIDEAVQIAYRNLIFYLTPQASYEDAVDGSMSAAKDLYGESSIEQKSVYDAWCAVGLCMDKYEYLFQGIDDVTTNNHLSAYIEDEVLRIMSDIDTEVYVYDVLGRFIHSSSIKANEWNSVNIGSNKIMIVKTKEGVTKYLTK